MLYTKLYPMLLSFLLAPAALAGGTTGFRQSLEQLPPRVLLSRAIQANGGQALRQVKFLHLQAQVKVVAADQKVIRTISLNDWLDYSAQRWLSVEQNTRGETERTLYTGQGAYYHSPRFGTVPLPRQDAIRDYQELQRGALGLRQSELNRAVLTNQGLQRWTAKPNLDIVGTVLSAKSGDMLTQYLLSADGRLLADRQFDYVNTKSTRVYVDPYWEQGIRLSRGWTEYLSSGVVHAEVRDAQRSLNVKFDPTLFNLPGLADAQHHPTEQPQGIFLRSVTGPDVFDDFVYRFAHDYNGLSTLRADVLRSRFLPELKTACDFLPKQVCPPPLAYPVLERMMRAIDDPHSMYYTPDEASKVLNAFEGKPAPSLGVLLLRHEDAYVILDIVPGGAAQKAGWQVGDQITQAGGQPILGADAAAVMRDLPFGQAVDFTLTRQGKAFHTTTKMAPKPDAPVSLTLRTDGLAVLKIRAFTSPQTAQQVHDAVRKLLQAGAKGVILDLRFNNGGSTYQRLLSEEAFKAAPSEQRQSRRSLDNIQADHGTLRVNDFTLSEPQVKNPASYDGPLVILVNETSASAAEYLTRSLMTLPDTTVLGVPTKGLANTGTTNFTLLDDSMMFLTTTQADNKAGQLEDARVTPNIRLPLDLQRLAQTGQDNMIEEAAKILNAAH